MAGFRADIAPLSQLPEWDALARQHPHGAVFASRRWLAILADVFGLSADGILVSDASGVLVGIPLLTRKRGPLRVAPPHPITLYNGIVAAPGTPREAITAGLAALERRCHFAVLLTPSQLDPRVFDDRPRWLTTEQASIVVDVADFDATWKQFTQSLRRKVRRAEEQSLVFRRVEDAGVLLALHQTSYARHAIAPPLPSDLLRAWLRTLQQEGIAECYGASLPAGPVIAARAVVPDGDVLFDWLAGADIAHHDIAASHWLVARILQEASTRGTRRFDFMGANTPGVTDFKRSFGGVTLPYQVATYYRYPIIQSLERARNELRLRKRRVE
jgi:hypothetical protein